MQRFQSHYTQRIGLMHGWGWGSKGGNDVDHLPIKNYVPFIIYIFSPRIKMKRIFINN